MDLATAKTASVANAVMDSLVMQALDSIHPSMNPETSFIQDRSVNKRLSLTRYLFLLYEGVQRGEI